MLVLCYNLPRAMAGSTVFRSVQENATGCPQNEISEFPSGFKVSTRTFPGVFALLGCPWTNERECCAQKGEASDA